MDATRVDRSAASGLTEIPGKLYFKIGEVAQLVGVESHVLRYWEKEIAAIRPAKSSSNQRRYRRRDVELFCEIRRLLYEEKYTLAGARKRLTGGRKQMHSPSLSQSQNKVATALQNQDGPNVEPGENSLIDADDEFMPVYTDAPPCSEGPAVTSDHSKPQSAPRSAHREHTKPSHAGLNRLRAGLRDLIRFAGEQP